MPNPKVSEIAKSINVTSKSIIELLKEYGIIVKNNNAVLEYEAIDVILTSYLNKYDDGGSIIDYFEKLHENDVIEPQPEPVKETKEDKPAKSKKEAPKKEEEPEEEMELEIKKADNKTIADTRQNNVDLEKIEDTIKAENLVDMSYEEKSEKKQKIKKILILQLTKLKVQQYLLVT